jgi:hypothetical protein
MFKDIICPAQRRMFLGELKTFRHERSIFLKASVRQDAQRGKSASASGNQIMVPNTDRSLYPCRQRRTNPLENEIIPAP